MMIWAGRDDFSRSKCWQCLLVRQLLCVHSRASSGQPGREHGRDTSDRDRPQMLIVCALLTARQCTITYSLSRGCWHVVIHKRKPHQNAMKRARSDAVPV